MDFVKVVVFSSGKMEVFMMEILSKVIEMDTVFGNLINKLIRHIKVIICWIKSTAMESIIGEMVTFIKGITLMIKETVMDSCIIKINLCIKENGLMEKK